MAYYFHAAAVPVGEGVACGGAPKACLATLGNWVFVGTPSGLLRLRRLQSILRDSRACGWCDLPDVWGRPINTRPVDDARRVDLSISPAGRLLLRRAPAVAQDRLIDALALIGARDRRTLAELFARVARAMDSGESAPPLFFEDEAAPPARAHRGRSPHE
jgi:hypothetical protein